MTFHSEETPRFHQEPGGLLPAIIQDVGSRAVLMSTWMNELAWRETLRTGFGVYFSHSSQSLWRKGESVGKRHKVVDIHVDSDAGTILIQVQQIDFGNVVPTAPIVTTGETAIGVSKAK